MRRIPPLLGHAEFVADAAFAVVVLALESDCAIEDCAAVTENMLIAAVARGIGSCWVAASGQPYGPAVVKALGAPPDCRLFRSEERRGGKEGRFPVSLFV